MAEQPRLAWWTRLFINSEAPQQDITALTTSPAEREARDRKAHEIKTAVRLLVQTEIVLLRDGPEDGLHDA